MATNDVINLLVSSEQKAIIDHAAKALGKNRTSFILDNALRGAEDVLLDRTLFRLDAEQWAEFNAMLDSAPSEEQVEKLRALFAAETPWKQ